MPWRVRVLTFRCSTLAMVSARTALIAIAAALAPAASASAADVSLTVAPEAGVRLGGPTQIGGRVTEAGAPLSGRIVALELRRHPYEGGWRRSGDTEMTAADGSYSFSRKLDRNHHVRVRLVGVAPEPDVLSPLRAAYVLPAFKLWFEQREKRMLRLRQSYSVPR